MILFRQFLDRLGIKLEEGQNVLVDLLDGVDPADMPVAYRDTALEFTGGVARFEPSQRTVLCLVAGGRSGKTYILSLFQLYKALTINTSTLAPGELAFAALVAPNLDLAQQNLNYLAGAVKSDKALSRMIVADTTNELALRQRPGGSVVSLRPFAAARGGVTGRGKSLTGLLMSETCFFRDASSGVVNDEVIYKAAAPRVMDGGLTLIESTPWAASGLLYDFYEQNFGHPKFAMVIHAPTVSMRSNPHILAIVAREYERDPDNAEVEFGARWGSTSSSAFFTPDDLAALFTEDPRFDAVPPQPGEYVAGAVDLGFVRNSATLGLISSTSPGGPWRVAVLEEMRPTAGSPLIPSEVCERFCATLKPAGVTSVVADGHYRETLREHTSKIGVALQDSCGPSERFTSMRALIREGRLKFAAKHPLASRLRRQLLGMVSSTSPGGVTTVKLPKGLDGSHGDLADVLARVTWGATRYTPHRIPASEESYRWSPGEKEMAMRLQRQEQEEDGEAWWGS